MVSHGLRALTPLVVAILMHGTAQAADPLQPFILAYTTDADLATETPKVRSALLEQQLEILGEYSPFSGAQVIAVSTAALRAAAVVSELGGFGAVIHVALTQVEDQLQVSYLNPPYMAAAYRLPAMPEQLAESLAKALGAKRAFGAGAGRSAEQLRGFHYMVGMEYFGDVYQLASHDSHSAALATLDANLERKLGGASLVYKLPLAEGEQVLYGISRAQVADQRANDRHILADTVDQDAALKTTAYLPYQLLVVDNRIVALHMRFRMAVFHPDLTMGTFGKLIASPAAIEHLLGELAGGKAKQEFRF